MSLGQSTSRLGAWALALLVLMIGVYWSFTRTSNDFSVFYSVFRIVLEPEPERIYNGHPDRYLYAPGFAWLLSWLSYFPREGALAIWNATKVCLLLAALYRVFGWKGLLTIPLAAKPLLIDFQYGQVNTQIISLSLWAVWLMTPHSLDAGRVERILVWMGVTFFGAAKLMGAPLLLLPLVAWWMTSDSAWRARHREASLVAVLTGLVLLITPFVVFGFESAMHIMGRWLLALQDRGLPLETHNQSFLAVIHHLFSGEPAHVVALARAEDFSTGILLPAWLLSTLSWSWVGLGVVFLLYGLVRLARKPDLAFALGWLAFFIVPGHLIWKPYFVFCIPLFGWALTERRLGSRARVILIGGAFALLNLTGFDFIGLTGAVQLEAWGVLLWALLWLLLGWYTVVIQRKAHLT